MFSRAASTRRFNGLLVKGLQQQRATNAFTTVRSTMQVRQQQTMLNYANHQQKYRNYSTDRNTSEEEEGHMFDAEDLGSPFVNTLKAMAWIGVGTLLGYYISSFVVDTVGFVPEDDDDDDEKSGEVETVADYQKQFDSHADIEVNGEKFMSPDAFIRSLIAPRPDTPTWVAYPRKDGKLLVDKRLSDEVIKMMFTYADADSDGMISFDEYSLFLTLVNSSKRRLKLAFQMFDLDGSGQIDINEFQQVINANKKDPNAVFTIQESGLAKHLFGPDGSQTVSFKKFQDFIESFKDQLLLHEFLLHDVEGKNEISVEAFNELITQSIHFNSINVPEFKKQLNILKTRGFFKPSGRVDFETFKAFHKMSEHIDDLKLAMQLYTAGGKDIRPTDFTRILNRVANLNVTPRVVDLVFALFDKNGDGSLSYREFVSTLEQRNNVALPLAKE